jgi:drug/metabolite transporter (DMT)-like permease
MTAFGSRLGSGPGQALLAAALFGVSTPLAKVLLAEVSPQTLAGLLYLGSGLGLTILWLLRRQAGVPEDGGLVGADLPWLAGAISFGGLFGPLLLLLGLAHTPASAASLLLNLEGVLTALLAWFVFRENVNPRVALGMTAIVFGGALLAWEGRLAWGGIGGPVAIAGACLCWAIDNNLTQKVSASNPMQIAALKGGVAGSLNLAIGTLRAGALPALPNAAAAMLLGFVGYGLSLTLFVLALRSLGTARTSAYFSVAPFLGALLSIILLHDRPTPLLVAAGGAMVLGVWLHLTERHEHEHVHDPLSHTHPHVHDEHHRHAHSPSDPPGEPHTHFHVHEGLIHRHPHYPDIHHRHSH